MTWHKRSRASLEAAAALANSKRDNREMREAAEKIREAKIGIRSAVKDNHLAERIREALNRA